MVGWSKADLGMLMRGSDEVELAYRLNLISGLLGALALRGTPRTPSGTS